MALTIDWSDPCAAAVTLRQRYNELLLGGQPIEVRFGDRWTKYAQGNLASLQELILRLENECAISQGNKPKRYAMRLGSFR